MQYRIEMSTTRRGAARVHLPGRVLELDTQRLAEAEWEVLLSDPTAGKSGALTVRAATASDAAWTVARAAVRAVAELTGQTIENGPAEPR